MTSTNYPCGMTGRELDNQFEEKDLIICLEDLELDTGQGLHYGNLSAEFFQDSEGQLSITGDITFEVFGNNYEKIGLFSFAEDSLDKQTLTKLYNKASEDFVK